VARGPFGGLLVARLSVLILMVHFREDDVIEFAPTTPGRSGGGAKTMPKASLSTVVPLGLDISGYALLTWSWVCGGRLSNLGGSYR